MSVESVAIKGVKTEGKYSLKGFEKNGKFISKDTLSELGDFLKSEPIKKVLGIGLTVGALYLFGPCAITAKMFKELVVDKCILDKQKSPMESVRNSVQATKDTMQRISADSELDKLGNGARNTENRVFDKGGERE